MGTDVKKGKRCSVRPPVKNITNSILRKQFVSCEKNMIQQAPLAMYCVNNSGLVMMWNGMAEGLFGWTNEEVIGQKDPTRIGEHTRQESVMRSNSSSSIDVRKCKTGRIIDVMIWTSPLTNDSGDIVGESIAVAPSRHNKVQNELDKARSVIEHILETADVYIWSNDLNNKIGSYSSEGSSKIFGYSHEMFENDPMLWFKCVHPDDRSYVSSIDYHGTLPVKAEFRIIRKDGETRWVAASIYPKFNSEGIPVLFEGITRDITEHKEFQRQLREVACTDFLTSLSNRYKFDKDLALATSEALSAEKQFGLLYIDFDGFKQINDTFGHQMGDMTLKRIAIELRSIVTATMDVYRIGGDEFTILIKDIKSTEIVKKIASSILDQFHGPLLVEGNKFTLTCSIGMSIYLGGGKSQESLLREADAAMYHAKELGGNRYCVFSREMTR